LEIAHGWGRVVYERLRAVDTPPGWKSPIRFLESVVGEQFGEIESKGFEGPGPDISPVLPVMSSQDLFEQILSDACRPTGTIDLRFGHRVTSVLSGWCDGDAYAEVEVESTRGAPYRLSGAAIVAADGIDSPVRTQLQIPLDGEGGRGKEKLSTLDLFGAGFTVLAGRDGAQWCLAAADARARFRVPVASYVIGAPGLEDRAEAFLERYEIASDGAVLVRPDGYVAWRAANGQADRGESLVRAVGQVLRLFGDSDDVPHTKRRIND
jgi:hypothetical protein